jgi:nicotinamidase/pyrazinamidase
MTMAHPAEIDASRDALLVVDLQPDFMPGGALAVAGGDQIAAPIGALARLFATVVATQDWHPRGHASFASSHPGKQPFEQISLHGAPQTLWPDHCLQGSHGARLHPALPDEVISLVLRKGMSPQVDSYSAFRENPGPGGVRPPTGLAGWLRERGVRRVFVCGLARDFCVRWTALDARAAGFEVMFLDDLTRAVAPAEQAAVDIELTAAGVRRMNALGWL